MRSVQQRLERAVCAEHCRYYKPWATPEPDCGPMQWLLERIEDDAQLLDAVERLRGRRLTPPLAQDSTLLRRVCTPCQHYPDNCAYRRPDRSPSAEPCGALLVLDTLLEKHLFTAEDLFQAVPQERRPA